MGIQFLQFLRSISVNCSMFNCSIREEKLRKFFLLEESPMINCKLQKYQDLTSDIIMILPSIVFLRLFYYLFLVITSVLQIVINICNYYRTKNAIVLNEF